jgi:S-adenosylmethionine/arginine decarboxylase-like enzyme
MTTTTDAPHRTPVIRRTHLEAQLGFFAPIIAPLLSWILFRRRQFRYGMELVVDIQVPDLDDIANPVRLQQFVNTLVEVIEMKAFPISETEKTWVRRFGLGQEHAEVTAGYTVIQPIETSSIVLHLSEGRLTGHLNVFSCKYFDPRAALEFIEAFFRAQQTTYTVLVR